MKTKITVKYVLDNDNWDDKKFDKEQDFDKTLIRTEDMIIDLINQNCNLNEGDYVSSIHIRSF